MTARLYGAGFGDGTVRGWALTETLTLDEVLWAGGLEEPINLGPVGATELDEVDGAWAIAETDSEFLVVSGKLAQAVVVLESTAGPLSPVSVRTQGELVEGQGDAVGLVPATGLERAGPVASSDPWVYVGGTDGLGLWNFGPSGLELARVDERLSGADALLVRRTDVELGTVQVFVVRCRGQSVDAPCLEPTDPAELILARHGREALPQPVERFSYDPTATDGRQGFLGDGQLALTTASDGRSLLLAGFEGSASVVGFLESEDGTFTSTGSFRIVAPWQDPAALPAFDGSAAETSTAAPLRTGQMAISGGRVFVAVRSGGFLAHFPLRCLGQPPTVEGCLEVVCLDAVGGCAGPSAASASPVYPYAVEVGGGFVFVGVDALDEAGFVTTRIAILAVDPAGGVSLMGFVDA